MILLLSALTKMRCYDALSLYIGDIVRQWRPTIGTRMNTKSDPAFEFVKQLGEELANKDFDIPSFPYIALQVRKEISDPNGSIKTLSRIILTEPMLTSRIMRMANSAMMRRGPLEVTSIEIAISRIGFDMVQNAAMSFVFREAFGTPDSGFLREHLARIRRHSTKVGVLAYVLAKKVKNFVKPDEAMLAGLLHAIGKFYILIHAKEFPELFVNTKALEECINAWYADVGRVIVESWDFPEQIVDAVGEHEIVDRKKSDPVEIKDIISVANLLVQADEEQNIEHLKLDQIPSFLRMNIDDETVKNLTREFDEEISSMTQALID